jgi:hypothetical protein
LSPETGEKRFAKIKAGKSVRNVHVASCNSSLNTVLSPETEEQRFCQNKERENV